jgi:peptidoglycan glycosyltransferase
MITAFPALYFRSQTGLQEKPLVLQVSSQAPAPLITREKIAKVIEKSTLSGLFPTEIVVGLEGQEPALSRIEYTLDAKLQNVMERLFQSYSPDYGAFVAIDAATGQVLSIVSYVRGKQLTGNLALRATFPSASIFKVVTAAAAIEEHKISADTVLPYNGRNHTLYRTQILKSKITRWTRYITFKQAFARSINTVFGRMGAFTVGGDSLRKYAGKFGFNRQIAADFPINMGHALIPEDAWGLAESASGFTLRNTMSPIQGALIAAAVANDGVMMEPYIVQSITKLDGTPLYLAENKPGVVTMDSSTASVIRALMKETIVRGTSRTSFQGFFKKNLAILDVGGKTGSLTGDDPRGKYDWFIGFADTGTRRIAVAALTISEKQWRVKSSYLARRAIESYFKETLRFRSVAQVKPAPLRN